MSIKVYNFNIYSNSFMQSNLEYYELYKCIENLTSIVFDNKQKQNKHSYYYVPKKLDLHYLRRICIYNSNNKNIIPKIKSIKKNKKYDILTNKIKLMSNDQKCDIIPFYNHDNNVLSGLTLFLYSCDMLKIPRLCTNLYDLVLIDCDYLEYIPKLPKTLSQLILYNCDKIKKINRFPTNLKKICICDMNNLQNIVNLPEHIEYIKMSNLPKLNISLLILNLRSIKSLCLPNCNLSYLPDKLPESLVYLNIDDNNINYLPKLRSFNFEHLSCNNNKNLSSIPKLSRKIKVLELNETSLHFIPKVFDNIKKVSSQYTNINDNYLHVSYDGLLEDDNKLLLLKLNNKDSNIEINLTKKIKS